MLQANFRRHELYHVIKIFEFKTAATLEVKMVMLPILRELLNSSLEQFEQLLCNAEHLDALHKFARFLYNPIIHQTEHPEDPLWCVAFVDLLKYAFQFKEWIHTKHR